MSALRLFGLNNDEIMDKLVAMGVVGSPDHTRRVVLDLTVGELPRFYVETFADDDMLGDLLDARLVELPKDGE